MSYVASIYRFKWRGVCYQYWNKVYTKIFPHALINAIIFCVILIRYDILLYHFCYFYRLQFLFNPNSETHPGGGNFTLDWNGSYVIKKRYVNSKCNEEYHYGDVVMNTMASQITSRTIAYPTVYSGADQRNHQSSASLAFVRGIHRWPVNSPHKCPVTQKIFPFDDVIMILWLQNDTSCIRQPK